MWLRQSGDHVNDSDGFDGGDFLTAGLFLLLVGQASQARQAEQQRAAQQAAAEQAIVHRGQAAMQPLSSSA